MQNEVEKIFLDTSFFFAWLNKDDDFHNDAINLIKSLKGKHVCFFTTDYIIDETLTLVLVKSGKKKAIEIAGVVIDFFRTDPHMRLVYIQEDVFMKAMKIFQKYEDKNWSFTDCTSCVVMKNLKIPESASFDKHFKEFGFKVLP